MAGTCDRCGRSFDEGEEGDTINHPEGAKRYCNGDPFARTAVPSCAEFEWLRRRVEGLERILQTFLGFEQYDALRDKAYEEDRALALEDLYEESPS